MATEACRTAINSDFFLNEVKKKKSNLDIEIISSEEEARLCLKSCKDYLNLINETGFLFDISGSTETTFFKNKPLHFSTTSVAYGVINLPEKIEIHGSTKSLKKSMIILFFYNSHKSFSNSLVTIGSCSTMTTICSIFS